jgi:hypothetical protein
LCVLRVCVSVHVHCRVCGMWQHVVAHCCNGGKQPGVIVCVCGCVCARVCRRACVFVWVCVLHGLRMVAAGVQRA